MNIPAVTRKEIFSWCMFDFANSAYTTVIITAVYSAFFAAKMADGATHGDFLWAMTLSLSYGLVVLSSPVAGALADAYGWHKRFLMVTYITCIACTAALSMAKPGQVIAAMILVIASNWAFAMSENMVSSFLPQLTDRTSIGRISGYGWSLGYIGGLLSLLVCLVFLEANKGSQGYPEWAIRGTCLFTAGFFFLAGLPTMVWLRQRSLPIALHKERFLLQSFRRLADTLGQIRRYREMAKFMVSFFFYSSGIATVISFAAIYGQAEFGFKQGQLILLIVLVNITSALGAFAFGFFQDKTSAKSSLIITLIIWIATVFWAFSAHSQAAFWGVANLAGIAIGASQSCGRAMVGLFAPRDKQAEFYGFWGFFGKGASIFGIFSYGMLTYLTGSRRIAVLATGLFFVIGLMLLLQVNERKGIEAGREAS